MKMDSLIRKITLLHIEHFLPLQYGSEYKEHYVMIRTMWDVSSEYFSADVIVCRGDTGIHEYMDGSYYYDGDGVGSGNTVHKALKDLLSKTQKSIKYKEEI